MKSLLEHSCNLQAYTDESESMLYMCKRLNVTGTFRHQNRPKLAVF